MLAAGLGRDLRDRYRCIYICLDEIGPLGKTMREQGFEVVCLDRRPGIDWRAMRRMGQVIRRYGVNLLHAHQYGPFFYAAMGRAMVRRPACRVLFTEHGREYPDWRRAKRVWANKWLLRRDDRVTAVGQYVADLLVANEGIASPRIEVILNGIDPNSFSQPKRDRAAVRQALAITDDQPMVIQVARFHPVKDHATGLRAFAQTAHDMPDARLVYVGDGPQRGAMERLAEDLGVEDRVRFVGVRTDVADLLHAADVFMLSSLSEGISVTLLEAMAAKLPIVATDVGGNAEVIEHGRTGWLAPRQDHEAMGAHLTRLLRDNAIGRAMGLAGRVRLHEHFTQARMHQAYAEQYNAMLHHYHCSTIYKKRQAA